MIRPRAAALVVILGLGLGLGLVVTAATCELAAAQAVDADGNDVAQEEKPEAPKPGNMLASVGSYALVGLGFIMVGTAVAKTFSSNMSYPQAKLTMVSLLRSNPYQAEMVGKKMRGTFVEALAAALKVGGMVGSQDPVVVQAATQPTYDGNGQAVVGQWGAAIGKAKLGLTAAIAGAAIGLSAGRALPLIIAVLVVAGFIRLFLFKQKVESDLVRARIEVLPEVDNAIIAGRFVSAPPGRGK